MVVVLSSSCMLLALQLLHLMLPLVSASILQRPIHDLERLTNAMTTVPEAVGINLPIVPAKHADFIEYVAAHPHTPMPELLQPYKAYDNELRKAFAQQPEHAAVQDNTGNLTPMFNTEHESEVKIRARDPDAESQGERDTYIMPLRPDERKANGSPAIVQSMQGFKTNFAIFSESSLADMDWNNVVVAGSAVVTSLLAVPEKHSGSKRALRNYYHEILAPASDVDLFIYGLSEEQAIDKIRQIEKAVRDALLVETTTIRTKNAITIASQVSLAIKPLWQVLITVL